MTTGVAGSFVPSCHRVTTLEISLYLGRDQPQGAGSVALQAVRAAAACCCGQALEKLSGDAHARPGICAPADEGE